MTDTYTPLLTVEEIVGILHKTPLAPKDGHHVVFARAIERAAIKAYQRQQWRPIETAPKDGTEILLADDEGNQARMRWDAFMRNGLFGDVKGFWTCPGRNFTWDHRGGYGPTKWMPLPPSPETQP